MPADVAVLVESYNETEHSTVERLASSLEAAVRQTRTYGPDARVVLADSGGNPKVERLLGSHFPDVQRIVTTEKQYDRAKAEAAAASDARIVVFLDGDCLPADDEWLGRLAAPIVRGETVAAGGFTLYEGGWLARVVSVMDFGYLLPRRRRPLGCYASNNSAFLAGALADTPAPDGPLRCACFAHAQRFLREGRPVELVTDALTFHEQVPLVAERASRGAQAVQAAVVDPEIHQAGWLRHGVRAAPLFLLDAIRWDVRRMLRSGGDVGLSPASRVAAVPVMIALRMLDLAGIVPALRKV